MPLPPAFYTLHFINSVQYQNALNLLQKIAVQKQKKILELQVAGTYWSNLHHMMSSKNVCFLPVYKSLIIV